MSRILLQWSAVLGLILVLAVMLPLALLRGQQQQQQTDTAAGESPAKSPSQTQPDPWAEKRAAMVTLLRTGRYTIASAKVLAAMGKVPRHEFVPANVRRYAYADQPLPIGHRQTISQPYVVAFMTEKLDPQPDEKVLEIGTGSGYQAAVLAHLVKEVYSIEIVEALAESAEKTLARLGYQNVHVKAGDGYKGWPEHAPFDAIIVTCAPTQIPAPLIEQLKEGGRMIIPVGPDGGAQELYLLVKKDGQVTQKAVLPVRFVPMTGEARRE